MEKTWMPTAAGILDIVSGSLALIFCVMMVLWFAFFSALFPSNTAEFNDFFMPMMAILMVPMAIFRLIAGILAIIGGIYALRRQKWGLALAGSIGALFSQAAFGAAAIVLTALSKKEFE